MLNATRLVNTDELKRRIAEALPISQVAADICDVDLIPAGHQYKSLCPLHDENTPSFHVNDAKGVFYCWGCKRGGDSITLVREVHHLDYREALVMLAQAADIDPAQYERPATREEQERDTLRAWCESWLEGLNYSNERTSQTTAQAYGIRVPMTPAGPWPVYFQRTSNGGYKSYLFQGTVVFPYRAPNGRLVGWKVRSEDKSRVFMTPNDFPLTEPTLFGIDVARPHIVGGRLIVVEGEWDCAVLHDHGILNVVAIGGSKWTDEQMELLRELRIREVVFWLDGDEGGRSAAEAIAKRWWKVEGINVRILLAAQGMDPEDMVRTVGPDPDFLGLTRARGALEWLLWAEWEREARESLTAKMDFVKWVQEEYGAQLNGVQQQLVLQEVARWLDVPEADVLDFVRAEKSFLQSQDSEKVVLGKALREVNYYMAARKRIQADDFDLLKHQRVWKMLGQLLADGLEFEPTVIRARSLQHGLDPEYVEMLMQTGDLNIGWHEDQVIDLSIRRSARKDADRFREVIADLSLPASQSIGGLTHSVTQKALGRASGAFREISAQVDQAVEVMHERMKNPDVIHGIDLGSQFPMLSRVLQGFQARRFVLLAATSGRGKSTLTLQWLTSIAIQQATPCDFISLEMDSDEILFKCCAHMTGIDSMKITSGQLAPDEARAVEQAMMRLRRSPLRVYVPDGLTPGEFILYAREAVMERRSEVFVVDYAQMVGPDPEKQRESRYEQLGDFAYKAKQKVARSLDVCVLCCAQLKREAAAKERPTQEDMGDSYELVRAADVIMLIHGDEDESAKELWVDKNRQGAGGQLIPVNFDKPANTFREIAGARSPDYRIE